MAEDPNDAAAQAASDQAAADAAAAAKAASERGFPENTPVAEMNDRQQAAYWQHYARQHETRVKAFGKTTPDEVAELRKQLEDLNYDLSSATDKAVADAKKAAEAEAAANLQPSMIEARLDAAAARAGVSEKDLADAVEFIDTKKFLAADGKVDTDKVKAFIATIKPAAGTTPGWRPGPSSSGQGQHQSVAGKPGDGARAALAKRGIKVPE